jgi:hypothetical protein
MKNELPDPLDDAVFFIHVSPFFSTGIFDGSGSMQIPEDDPPTPPSFAIRTGPGHMDSHHILLSPHTNILLPLQLFSQLH